MKKISRYIFSLLIFSCLSAGAQTNKSNGVESKIGFDISRFAIPVIENGRTEYEGSIDLRVKGNLYPVIEMAWGNYETEKVNFSYRSSGYSIRAGIDKNYLKKENVGNMGMFFAGFRYGISFFEHEAPDLQINDPYWGDLSATIPGNKMSAHWLEFTTGIRAKILENIYLGWSLRGRLLIFTSDDENMSPKYIPGYGKVNERTNLGFRYSIFYRLPL